MKVRVLGTVVACDRPLAGLQVAEDCPVEIVVTDGGPAPSRPASWVVDSDWPLIAEDGRHVLLWYDDDVVFVLEPGLRELRYMLFRELDEDTFTHELVDSALPRLLSTFGHLVVHGGSVAGRSGAIVLVGESGIGKSTLSAALAARGHRLITDDVAVITRAGESFEVLPAGTSLRLNEASAVHALNEPILGPPMAHWSEKRLVPLADNRLAVAEAPTPLRAVVRLVRSESSPSLQRLDHGVAFEVLARNCFDLPDSSPMAGLDLLDRWGPLAGAVPTFELSRRFDLGALSDCCDLLDPLLDGEG